MPMQKIGSSGRYASGVSSRRKSNMLASVKWYAMSVATMMPTAGHASRCRRANRAAPSAQRPELLPRREVSESTVMADVSLRNGHGSTRQDRLGGLRRQGRLPGIEKKDE